MKLYLDATDNRHTVIKLDDEVFEREVTSPRDQNVFGFLTSCLKEKGAQVDEITEIEVNSGPGSFTGTRIGVAIANALAYALNIKVNGQEPPVEPIYSSPPSITKPKS